ncbi:hypothetical protein HELRODRAFT_170561 [Helobdella robusta]|uniref:FUN14 domain-containing protein n=1 Tax=Helobdella robusta TaxID=6412 RepID=T1F367_HELRO|nr:hypothetical protein HELRODRAFT_170561 [Helobdella robusta]ESO07241.1 hypothetical protein HELRODRAFT_170561 [Helobdella robusta]
MAQQGFNDYLRSDKGSPRSVIMISAHGDVRSPTKDVQVKQEDLDLILNEAKRGLDKFSSSSNNNPNAWMNEILNEVTKSSPAKQVAIGGISGWCSGYLIGKVGKIALIAVGGSFIILQLAHNQGLIQINWNAIESKVNSTQKEMKKSIDKNLPGLIESAKDFGLKYLYLSGSFCAGLLLGICS